MKNKYEVRGEITVIYIISKKYGEIETIIDTDDLELANLYPNSWCAHYDPHVKGFYIVGKYTEVNKKRKSIVLHRLLMGFPDGKKIDHLSHDTLDNRRSSNLRAVTNSENLQNKVKARSDSKSGILGVFWNANNRKWLSQIRVNGKLIHLGSFTDIVEAERVVKEARGKYMPFSQENSTKVVV